MNDADVTRVKILQAVANDGTRGVDPVVMKAQQRALRHMSKAKASQYLRNHAKWGIAEKTPKGKDGRFTRKGPPQEVSSPVENLAEESDLKAIFEKCRKRLGREVMDSLVTGQGAGGPKGKSFMIFEGGHVLNEELYDELQAFLPAIEKMVLKHGRRMDSVALILQAVFVHAYPAGVRSGMGTHVDNLNGHGAAVFALRGDSKGDEGFYTMNKSRSEKTLWKLSTGQCMIVHPEVPHGVETCVREKTRMTLNFFY